MKNHRILTPLFVFLLAVTSSARAQIDLSTISARAGVIRTLVPDYSASPENRWSFYPEVEVGGDFFTPSLSWGVSWGYWSDSGDDFANYNDQSYILGIGLSFRPQVLAPHWLIPFKLSGGIAEHFISRARVDRYISGHVAQGPVRYDGTFHSMTLYAGLGLSFNLSPAMRLEAEAAQFIPVGEENLIYYEQEDRRVITLGVVFVL